MDPSGKPDMLLFMATQIIDAISELDETRHFTQSKSNYVRLGIVALVIASKYYESMDDNYELRDFELLPEKWNKHMVATSCIYQGSDKQEDEEDIIKTLILEELLVLKMLKWKIPRENVLFYLDQWYNRGLSTTSESSADQRSCTWFMMEYIGELSLWDYEMQKWHPWYVAFSIFALLCHERIREEPEYQCHRGVLVEIVQNNLRLVIQKERAASVSGMETLTTKKFLIPHRRRSAQVVFKNFDNCLATFLNE
jgi:hypothetical protein